MNRFPLGSGNSGYGGFLDHGDDLTPVPGRNQRPPQVWGTVTVEGEDVVVRLQGWRAAIAMRRTLTFPAAAVNKVVHDPAVRAHVSAKLRKRGGRSGMMRVGPYHSLQGWSFWSVGLARNAVLIETSGFRYRYVVVEVADPTRTVAEVRSAAKLGDHHGGAVPGDPRPGPPAPPAPPWGAA